MKRKAATGEMPATVEEISDSPPAVHRPSTKRVAARRSSPPPSASRTPAPAPESPSATAAAQHVAPASRPDPIEPPTPLETPLPRRMPTPLPPPGIQVSPEDLLETVAQADVPREMEELGLSSPQEILEEEAAQGDVADELFEIERKLDRILRDAGTLAGDPVARRRAAEALSQIATRLEGDGAQSQQDDATVLDVARELLSTDYYFRQWGRVAMRNRSEEVDDFGLDPTYEARVQPLFNLLYKRYFRVDLEGIENVPDTGRTLLVANHGGALPWDGAMLKTAIKLEHPKARELRWLAEDFHFHFPFLGAFLNRIGAVRACQENAERLLRQEKLVAVFPEGINGIGKLYKNRYQLQRFGRGGYIKLALRTRTSVVPTAILGADEAHPLLFKLTYLAKGLGVPFIPVTPTFPWLGPLGLAPIPAKWRIVFGVPIDLAGYGPEAADDAILVNRLNEKVRSTIQSMIDEALATRRSALA